MRRVWRASRKTSSQTRPHQRARRATIRAAAQARHKVVGQGLLPASPNMVPMRKPTIAPRIISAFMQRSARVEQMVCQHLPCPPGFRQTGTLKAEFGREQQLGNSPLELARNFLPGAQISNDAVCAQYHVPQLDAP